MNEESAFNQGYHLGLDPNNHDTDIGDLFDSWVGNSAEIPPYKEFQAGFLMGHHDYCSRQLTSLCWEMLSVLQKLYDSGRDAEHLSKVYDIASEIESVLSE
jgi:hypothetical protein